MRILSDIHDGKQSDFVLHDDLLFQGNRLCSRLQPSLTDYSRLTQ